MKRKDFLQLSAMTVGATLIPKAFLFGRSIDPLQAVHEAMDTSLKKELADVALNAAKAKGATYTDVRIGRYLNQFVATQENKVQNVANTESFGAGVRVLANGCWGFAASDNVTKENIARTAERAVAVAKANAKIQGEPVQLAPQKGYGEVSWKAPIEKNTFEVPVKEKVDLLLSANALAMANGANFVNSIIFGNSVFCDVIGFSPDAALYKLPTAYCSFICNLSNASTVFQSLFPYAYQ